MKGQDVKSFESRASQAKLMSLMFCEKIVCSYGPGASRKDGESVAKASIVFGGTLVITRAKFGAWFEKWQHKMQPDIVCFCSGLLLAMDNIIQATLFLNNENYEFEKDVLIIQTESILNDLSGSMMKLDSVKKTSIRCA